MATPFDQILVDDRHQPIALTFEVGVFGCVLEITDVTFEKVYRTLDRKTPRRRSPLPLFPQIRHPANCSNKRSPW